MINQEVFGIYLNLNEKKAIIISIKGYKFKKEKITFIKRKTMGFNFI